MRASIPLRHYPELAAAGGDISAAAKAGESLSTLGQVQEISRTGAGAEEVGSAAGKLDEAGELGEAGNVTDETAVTGRLLEQTNTKQKSKTAV